MDFQNRTRARCGHCRRSCAMTLNAALGRLLEDFKRALLRQQVAPSTIHSYSRSVRELLALFSSDGSDSLASLTAEHLERWQDQVGMRPLQASTRAVYGTGVRQFIRWAAERELVDGRLERSVVRVKCFPKKPRPLAAEDLRRVIEYLGPRHHGTSIELRDRALFYFLLETGARISEALQVTRDNFVREIGRASCR